jgi:5,10-methylenetetrahydromethanopterin reductase
MVGVIGHLTNPTVDQVVELAATAESAGAEWLGLADAFWWRDVWILLAHAARATTRLVIGPAMTNPYLRHPFHTVSAIATLQEIAGPRVMLGISAGGSELRVAARVSRRDAPERAADLAGLIRAVAGGAPLDEPSGRRLDVPLSPVPILMAGRGDRMLDAVGRHADRALVWAVPKSDLRRSVARIDAAACDERSAPGERPAIVWAPLVATDSSAETHLQAVAAYAALNTASEVRRQWGLDDERVASIRARLVQGGTSAAIADVPRAALDDLLFRNPDPPTIATVGREIGATSLAIPGFATSQLPSQIDWARRVESLLAPA